MSPTTGSVRPMVDDAPDPPSSPATAGPTGPGAAVRAAAAVNRLARALVEHQVDPAVLHSVAVEAEALAAEAESGPVLTKTDWFAALPDHQRIEHFVTHGHWPPPPPDGGPVTFDAVSFIGGTVNPIGAGARFERDGDEAVGRVRLSRLYEGPPGRGHGGAVAAVFDEVMGAVFRVRSLPTAFTGTLSVRYEAPTPLDAELVFRARVGEISGRKHEVTAVADGPDGRFASATGVFIALTPEQAAAAARTA